VISSEIVSLIFFLNQIQNLPSLPVDQHKNPRQKKKKFFCHGFLKAVLINPTKTLNQ